MLRSACLVVAVIALLPAMRHTIAPMVVPAMSPLVAIASLLAGHTFQATALLGLTVGVIGLVRGRWFCRWACPTGLCADCAGRAGRRLGLRCPRLPPVGQAIALLTLTGACLGYPLLLWLDPLALFCGPFNVPEVAIEGAAWWWALALPVVVLLSVLVPGAWCARLCPLGALQELFGLAGQAARGLVLRTNTAEREKPGRRQVLAMALWAGAGALWAAGARIVRAAVPRPLRPPGAVEELRFAGLCVRCGNCIRACPTRILRPDSAEHGLAAVLAPVVSFQEDYCLETCTRCMDACPSGALARCAPQDKRRTSIGLPRVDMEVCRLGNDQECSTCMDRCPFEAITKVFSETEYTLTPKIDPAKCPGCGACQVACPTEPKAIVVV
jgi:ferredoxin-type protein NapF